MQNYNSLTFKDYNKLFKDNLSKPQFDHFDSRISGMLNGAVHGSEIARGYSNKHETSERRFLSESKWDHETINRNRIVFTQNSLLSNPSKYTPVAFDDTINKKFGKTLPGVKFQYSNTEKRTVWSQCFVTSLMIIDGVDFPLFSDLYVKGSGSSKLDLAIEQINKIPELENCIIVITGDTWYSAKKVIKAALDNNHHYVGMIKKNRLIKPENIEHWMSISDIASKLRKDKFHHVTVKDVKYRFSQVIGSIKGFQDKKFKILITQQRLKKERRWSRCYYLLTTDPSMSPRETIELYRERWMIETFYKFGKERLGLSKSRVLGEQALSRFVILLFFAYTYLTLSRCKQSSFYKGVSTLYAAQRTVWHDEKKFLIDKICILFDEGVPTEEIKIRLAS
ncbi:MAG: transposase [Candidatus Heimdallarchaeota archaeon]